MAIFFLIFQTFKQVVGPSLRKDLASAQFFLIVYFISFERTNQQWHFEQQTYLLKSF